MALTTRTTVRDGCSVVALEGELDLATGGQLWDELAAIMAEHDAPIVLDLAELTFCDSVGLGVLVRAHNALQDRGQRLVIANPTLMVDRILQVSGLSQAITAAPDVDAAVVRAVEP
jgi:anti-anti-sigma factor